MKKWYCLITVIMFTACQKGIDFSVYPGSGSGQTNNAIAGTWKFDSLSANTQSIMEYMQSDSDYKTITYSNYTTTKNSGVVTFNNDSTCTTTNINYHVSSTANGYNYVNGILVDSNAIPFSFFLDSSSTSGKYELIGNDSIYFPEGFISTSASSSQGIPSGGKFSISGNMLTITQTGYTDTTEEIAGAPYHITEGAKFTLWLQKQ